MRHLVITIGCEYGAKGNAIGRKIAEDLNIKFYNRDLVDEIIEDKDIAIVVELMGAIEPAKTFITRALEAGKHVVTANKDLLAVHGTELLEIAKEHNVALTMKQQ